MAFKRTRRLRRRIHAPRRAGGDRDLGARRSRQCAAAGSGDGHRFVSRTSSCSARDPHRDPARDAHELCGPQPAHRRGAGRHGDVRTRQAMGGPGIRATGTLQVGREPRHGVMVPTGPRPAAPGARQTAIEMPWRLILSPHTAERWRHAQDAGNFAGRPNRAVALAAGGAQGEGSVIEPPRPDPQRTVRAVWALTGEGSTKAMQGKFPVSDDPEEVSLELPTPSTSPFRMPLDDFDRFQIAHLSSNFSRSEYTPRPVGANLLMLSALGGWLDSRGAWVPAGHVGRRVGASRVDGARPLRASRLQGVAFPFGHKVALVKVSERKFHNGALDTTAAEDRSEDRQHRVPPAAPVHRPAGTRAEGSWIRRSRAMTGRGLFQFQMPFSSVRILTPVTPNLDQPDVDRAGSRLTPREPSAADVLAVRRWQAVRIPVRR